MNNISISIDKAQLEKYLGSMPEKMNKALQNIIYKSTLLVERYAKMKTPVDTGRLRSSIFTEIHPMRATVSTNTNYAIYIHDGTKYISPRPFMTQASDTVAGQMGSLIENEIQSALK